MLDLVISGGQTGADIAGLRAAKDASIPTACLMPCGFRTLDGPKPEYVQLYNARQHKSSAYSPRTDENVLRADGTIRLATDFGSAGERCTWNAIVKHRKAYFDVPFILENSTLMAELVPDTVRPIDVVQWIREKKIRTLNVAGNSERTQPGIEAAVYKFLSDVFQRMRVQ